MDTLKDLWAEFKERITNPFFASFTLSWLIYNYKIPVIFFFDKKEGFDPLYSSYVDVIQQNAGWWHMLVWPVVTGLVYTFAVPYFKSFVRVFLAGINFDEAKKISKRGEIVTIPIATFTQTRNALKTQEIEYAKLINEEGETKAANEALTTRIATLILEHDENVRKLNSANDTRVQQMVANENTRVSEIQDKAQMEINGLQAIIKSNEELINRLNQSDNDLQTQISELSATMQVQRNRISQLEVENELLAHERDVISENRDEINDELKKKKDDINSLNGHLTQSNGLLKFREEEFQKAQINNDEILLEERARFQNQIREIQERIQTMTDQGYDNNIRLKQEHESQIENMNREIDRLNQLLTPNQL